MFKGLGRGVPALATCLTVLVVTAAATAAAPKPDAVRPCGSRGDTDRPLQVPVRIGARLGPLVIWSSIRDPYLGSRGGAFPYFIKAPIVLPARTVATLAVPPAYRHLVAFEADASWVSSVEFHACRESTRAFPAAYRGTVGKYTGFPFGFGLARRSLCVPLEVWVRGRTAPIRRVVPFGRRTC